MLTLEVVLRMLRLVAAETGDIEMFEWLCKVQPAFDEEICKVAARAKKYKFLKRALELGCPMNEWSCSTECLEAL